MWKILGGVFIGVFIGALAVEIINRQRPTWIRDIEEKAEHTANVFLDSFKKGYGTKAEETQV